MQQIVMFNKYQANLICNFAQQKKAAKEQPFFVKSMMQLFVFFQNIFYTIRRNTSINLLTNHYHWC